MRSFVFVAAATAALCGPLALAAPVVVLGTDENVYPASRPLQNILSNTHRSDGYSYPTDLTRNIIPKPIHSHNDYWRDIPFYTALSHGCISIEADVYLINSTLYVGHEPSALTPTRTLASLYITPLLNVLHRQNPNTPFSSLSPNQNGVFDTDSTQTLYLFIDLKTDGDETWPAVLEALEPLRQEGFLATYDPKNKITRGAVTVIATGNAPLTYFNDPTQPRDTFYDAPLSLLLSSSSSSSPSSTLSPYASLTASHPLLHTIGFPALGSAGFNSTQLDLMRSQIQAARDFNGGAGIGVRYWDTPAWPVSTRNLVWKTLVDLGVMFVNADLVGEAAGEEGEGGVW